MATTQEISSAIKTEFTSYQKQNQISAKEELAKTINNTKSYKVELSKEGIQKSYNNQIQNNVQIDEASFLKNQAIETLNFGIKQKFEKAQFDSEQAKKLLDFTKQQNEINSKRQQNLAEKQNEPATYPKITPSAAFYAQPIIAYEKLSA